jgi:transposase
MLPSALLPAIPGLVIELTISGEEAITLVVRLLPPASCCSTCGAYSTRVHSRARRTLTDLPASGRLVRLVLQVRRFFCSNSACPRLTFTEQVPELALPRKHRTQRLQENLAPPWLCVRR